jgi:hypothetical protein
LPAIDIGTLIYTRQIVQSVSLVRSSLCELTGLRDIFLILQKKTEVAAQVSQFAASDSRNVG